MKTEQGLIKWIILIIIALIILGYYHISVQHVIESPGVQANLSYAQNIAVTVWTNYLKAPATYLWNLFIEYVWNPALNHLMHQEVNQIINQIAPQATTTGP